MFSALSTGAGEKRVYFSKPTLTPPQQTCSSCVCVWFVLV